MAEGVRPLSEAEWFDLARAGYHEYGVVTSFLNYLGLPLPEFEYLGATQQSAWVRVAQYAATQYEQLLHDLSRAL